MRVLPLLALVLGAPGLDAQDTIAARPAVPPPVADSPAAVVEPVAPPWGVGVYPAIPPDSQRIVGDWPAAEAEAAAGSGAVPVEPEGGDTGRAERDPARTAGGAAVDSPPTGATAADSLLRRRLEADSLRRLEDDTSLTARMDARRGGGLQRRDFPDLLGSARAIGRYRVFLRVARAAGGAGERLTGSSPHTLFAPTDRAFAQLDPERRTALERDSTRARALLAAHLVAGEVTAADFLARRLITTLAGDTLRLALDSTGHPQVNGTRIAQRGVLARDGVLYGLPAVMPFALGGADSLIPRRHGPER